MNPWRLGYRPQLDAIRAMAVVLVLVAHLDVIPLIGTGGAVGVCMFFTLSGFLITTLLLEERDRFGKIEIPAFYKRRALRLVPAMVACVALACAGFLVQGYSIPDWTLVIGTLTYTSNWVMIGYFPSPSMLGHTWSLAIEEQFYLIWPIVIVLTAAVSKRRMIQVLSALCVVVMVWRFALYDGGEGYARIYFGLDTRADSLFYGAILAFALNRSRRRPDTPWWVLWLGLALIGTGCFMPNGVQIRVMPVTVGIGTALAIYAIAEGRGWKPFEWAWVSWIGKRAYGLYLYQLPVFVFLRMTVSKEAWISPFVILGTFVLAALSYRFLEQPFLRIKDRDRRSRRGLEQDVDASSAAPTATRRAT